LDLDITAYDASDAVTQAEMTELAVAEMMEKIWLALLFCTAALMFPLLIELIKIKEGSQERGLVDYFR
jgi:hypothetical protein